MDATSRPRVLVVDDDPTRRAALCSAIDGEGLQAIGAATEQDAFRRLGSVSVAIVEDPLLETRGSSLLEALRRRDPRLRVIVHTRSGSYESAKAAVNLGAFSYLDASSERDELLRAVHRAVDDVSRDRTDPRDRLEEQLRQSQKMQALGQLAGGVAHDFNNLLTVILGNTESILDDALDADRPVRGELPAVERIRHAGERAAAMTRQLLAFSRHQVRRLDLVPINRVVERLDDLLRRLIPETIQLETRIDPRAGEVKADASQLEQIVVNIVLNSRDAMPDSGTLTVETGVAQLEPGEARALGLDPAGTYSLLSIRDTGRGMSPEVAERAFEPFFTTKPTGQGTGLGLATVYGIVSQSRGAVSIDSTEGQGTEVRVYLPRVGDGVSRPQVAEKTEPAAGGSETVLLCEDEPMVLELARNILLKAGYHVLTADDGRQALELAGELDDDIDLLLTDVVMPGMNGVELARRLKERRPDLQVLFVSGYPDDVVLSEGGVEDPIEFLEKPFSAATLRRRVRRILDESD